VTDPISHGTLLERTLSAGPTIEFHPILELRGDARQLFAMDAIAHGPDGTLLENAGAWIAEVQRCHREIDADRASLTAIAIAAKCVVNVPSLSIHVQATTIECDERFPQFLAEAFAEQRIAPSRAIVGISDQRRFRDAGTFFAAVERLRKLGVRIALDDVGAGGTRPHLFVELRPDFYRLDSSLIRDCARRPRARATLDVLAQHVAESGGRIIAQGVETVRELETIAAAGIELVQGPFFSPPARVLPFFLADAGGVVPQPCIQKA
jgi:EAL domain-containing protein (putative c-di-GMP-specific phosphodiesterase class I)